MASRKAAAGALRGVATTTTTATATAAAAADAANKDSGVLIRSLYRCLLRRGRWFDARPSTKAVRTEPRSRITKSPDTPS